MFSLYNNNIYIIVLQLPDPIQFQPKHKKKEISISTFLFFIVSFQPALLKIKKQKNASLSRMCVCVLQSSNCFFLL